MMVLLYALGAFAADPTIEELLRATDDVSRGDSSQATIEMQVKTSRYERSMKMQVFSKGTEKSLIRILEPAKDAGVATLKVDENLWNYLPKVDRTMKVPAGMMSGAWMGSHFTNDDLVRESRLSEDFTYEFVSKPQDGKGNYVIACVPKPDAPVVWGKVVVTVRADQVPVKVDYFDERGELVRSMEFSDVQTVDGKLAPMRFRLVPHDKPGEFTEMRYSELDLAADLDDRLFTLQALKK
ncbi:MAG: outer membrane lipoprotein-sorting protein [Myxococcota bacterium]